MYTIYIHLFCTEVFIWTDSTFVICVCIEYVYLNMHVRINMLRTYIGHSHFPLSYRLSRNWNISPNRCFEQECYMFDPGLHFTRSPPKQILWSTYPQAVVPPDEEGHNAVNSSRLCESCISIVMYSASKQGGMENLPVWGCGGMGLQKWMMYIDYMYNACMINICFGVLNILCRYICIDFYNTYMHFW